MPLSRLFSSPFREKDKHGEYKVAKSGPPAYMFGSPSPGLSAYAFSSPNPTKQGVHHDFQSEMHDVRLDNYQDDLLPSEEELKIYRVRPSKVSFIQKRWFHFFIYGILCIIILVSLSCMITYSIRKKAVDAIDATDEQWNLPSGFVNVDSRLQETIKLLLNSVDHKVLTDTNSPQFQAARWIADIDALQIPLESTIPFKQRYALAVIWFATSGENWENWDNFLTESNECDWRVHVERPDEDFEMGVQCNLKQEVTSIVLRE